METIYRTWYQLIVSPTSGLKIAQRNEGTPTEPTGVNQKAGAKHSDGRRVQSSQKKAGNRVGEIKHSIEKGHERKSGEYSDEINLNVDKKWEVQRYAVY